MRKKFSEVIFLAYVQVPKDMTEVQTRLILNLTKRQVVCFGIAAAVGVPVYIMANNALGSTAAMMLMIVTTLPAFFFAIYKKDGIPAEKFILLVFRQKFFYPPIRTKPKTGKEREHGKKASATGKKATRKSTQSGGKRKASQKRQARSQA
jgi:hypothetical protein